MIVAGNHQRGFGHAVAGIETLGSEAAVSERCGKAFHRFGAYRFGTRKCDAPATQVQGGALLRRDFAQAEIISEIRPPANRSMFARNSLQPAQGTLQEDYR